MLALSIPCPTDSDQCLPMSSGKEGLSSNLKMHFLGARSIFDCLVCQGCKVLAVTEGLIHIQPNAA